MESPRCSWLNNDDSCICGTVIASARLATAYQRLKSDRAWLVYLSVGASNQYISSSGLQATIAAIPSLRSRFQSVVRHCICPSFVRAPGHHAHDQYRCCLACSRFSCCECSPAATFSHDAVLQMGPRQDLKSSLVREAVGLLYNP
jgi:hypothetical protein